MADYYNEFSFVFDLGSRENALVARQIAQNLKADFSVDDEAPGGDSSIGTDDEADPGCLWIYSERTGDI